MARLSRHGTKPGPKPYLSAKEECDLADHLIQSAKIGYGKTRKEVKSIVEKVAREKELFRGSKEIAKKAEERTKRNELRARKAEEKAEEKARKELEKKRKRAKSIECQEDGGSAHNVVQPKKSTRICTNPKRARLQDDDDISGDKCCVCFQDFEEDVELGIGIEWAQCTCTRWLHEDCILDCITGISGKERFCPYCT